MNRRSFLTLLSAVPGLSFVKAAAVPIRKKAPRGETRLMLQFLDYTRDDGTTGTVMITVEVGPEEKRSFIPSPNMEAEAAKAKAEGWEPFAMLRDDLEKQA